MSTKPLLSDGKSAEFSLSWLHCFARTPMSHSPRAATNVSGRGLGLNSGLCNCGSSGNWWGQSRGTGLWKVGTVLDHVMGVGVGVGEPRRRRRAQSPRGLDLGVWHGSA